MAQHSVEHMVGSMLQCNIEILADIRIFGHHRQEVEREIVWIGIMKANPLDSGDLCNLLDKFSDIESTIKILAIARQILSYELELMHSIGNESTDFFDYLFDRTRLVATCNKRNGTIGAHSVAALSYLDIFVMRRSGTETLCLERIVPAMTEISKNLLPVELAIYPVYFRNLFKQFSAITLRKATHDKDLTNLSAFLRLAQFQYHVDALLLGIANKATGIDNDDFALDIISIVEHLVATSSKLPHQTLAIDEVLATPHCYEVNSVLYHFPKRLSTNARLLKI